MRISFHGAAGEVTGSCTLIETGDVRFLVDCGMFQGGREARSKNLHALDFGFDVRGIDFVLLTHAHIDHSGLLPRLAVMGFRGPIYATPATIALLEVLLPDSAHIQEKESEWQLRHRRRRGQGERGIQPPLYTVAQALASLQLLRPISYGRPEKVAENVSVTFRDAGHILGSSWLEVTIGGEGRPRKLVFSGDLGMRNRPVLRDPDPVIPEADLLVIESTYGDRLHRPMQETEDEIVAAVGRTQACHGNLIIPSFAVGRTQEIIYLLADLVRRERLAPLKVFVDSPMANQATSITLAHPALLDSQTRDLIDWMRQNPHKFKVEFVADVEGSRALNAVLENTASEPLKAYPYPFRVLRVTEGTAVMGTPRNFDVPALRVIGVLYPNINVKDPNDPAFIEAQQTLAARQSEARAIVAAQPGIKDVRWELDKTWLGAHGIDVPVR